jgi:hypothetical protein
MPRDDDGRSKRREPDEAGPDLSRWLPAFAVIPLIFLLLLTAIHILRRDAARPAVGDMVVFNAATPDREALRISVSVWRVDPAEGVASRCVLNSSVMAASGGSLIVIRRLPTDPAWYRLQWAGGRTDEGTRDCGTAATVEIGRVDLRKLATAAGGFGIERRSWLP